MKYIRTKDGKIYELQETKSKEKYLVKANELIPLWNTTEYEIIEQANTIEELCDAFEVTRYEGTSWFTVNTYTNFKKAYSDWYGCGYQGVTSNLYGLVNGKRVAILRGYTEGKHRDKIEMELL